MGRDFNAATDNAVLGSDASIDDFTTFTVAFWVKVDSLPFSCVTEKGTFNRGWTIYLGIFGEFIFVARRVTANGSWSTTTTISTGTYYHIAITYDNSSTANVPIIYINGIADTLTVNSTPSGANQGEAANNLIIGEGTDTFDELDGIVQNYLYHNAILAAADINQHMWHGRFPGMKVNHPLYTTKVANEGSATADITLSGTTVISIPKTSRPGCGVF